MFHKHTEAGGVRNKLTHNVRLRERELGNKPSLGSTNDLFSRLYSSIKSVGSWDHGQNLRNAVHGGVFNLEFSPDGSLLVAACEKKSILMFDPLTHRMINGIDNAHNECVNCVRFLDSRLFATCSDDTTVALWDARNLKHRIHTLRGHKNWVKNIEYSAKDDLLVTSGFDGSIYTWDINNYSDRRVFHTNGLMRMRLSPDASKMVISTTGGYLMVVHDLDLTTMAQDLAGFKPNMYRLEQQNEWCYPNRENYTHLFSRRRKRNRVEFITDFPNGIEAEVISSLQVHPQGWCALSRNICNEESAEWTCVHDIQDLEVSDTDSDPDVDPDVSDSVDPFSNPASPSHQPPITRANRYRSVMTRPVPTVRRVLRVGEIVRHGGTYTANLELQVSSSDVWEALVAVREARVSRQQARQDVMRNHNRLRVEPVNAEPAPVGNDPLVREGSIPTTSGSVVNFRVVADPSRPPSRPDPDAFPFSGTPSPFATTLRHNLTRSSRLHKNVPRLLNYIEEPNVGKGFIKELCFSADGRLICSPFSFGVRLLAFSPHCEELSTCAPELSQPVKLYEVGSNICHSNTVVSTKFSPRHCLLVSGCLNGKIVWYQPVV